MKTILIYLTFMISTKAASLEDGSYTWLRLNEPGKQNTHCLPETELQKLKPSEKLTGSLEIKGDRLISRRTFESCTIEEQSQIVSEHGPLIVLKALSLDLEGCENINQTLMVNVHRVYDEENISFSSSLFKTVEVTRVGDFIQMKRRENQCFYGVKR